jgi:phosphoglycerol transferase MdoB-like AlkP superfamily enzyme
MRQRLGFLITAYVWTLVVFIVAKLCFMLACREGHELTVSDVWAVVCHGFSLDCSTALYVFCVPFLLVMVSIWWQPAKVFYWLLAVFFALIAVAMSLAFVADTSLYPFWGFKLDASCLQYLDSPTEAMASVSTGYMVLRVLLFLLAAAIIYWGYPRFSAFPVVKHRVFSTVGCLLCIPLIVIGIRGGLGESTTNIGQVYFSQNQFLNHSAVNPVFSFVASFEKTATNNVTYHFMDDQECQRLVSELYPTDSTDSDTLLTTRQPNIIVILLESCGGTFTEIGGRTDVTPNLNRLAREGIYFTNCYGNTWRTDRGTVCTWSGYPSFPTMSVMKMPAKSNTLPCIARTLKTERRYSTHYLYGGDINFTNMRSYLVGGGFETLKWMKDFAADEQTSAKWGVRDDITFGSLYQLVHTARQPFLIGFSTLSSHQPWDVPIRQFDDEVLNAFYYLDQCLGSFISQLKKSPQWKNTLVILLPDHGITYKHIDERYPLKNHIPMIWVGGVVKEPRRIEAVCNQTDLPATLLGQLGIRHDDYTFSRDVLSSSYTQPFAINTYDDGFSMYDSTSFVNYDFISNRVVASKGGNDQLLIQRAKAILQAASKDLNER